MKPKKKFLSAVRAKIKRLVDNDPITIQDRKTMKERWGWEPKRN